MQSVALSDGGSLIRVYENGVDWFTPATSSVRWQAYAEGIRLAQMADDLVLLVSREGEVSRLSALAARTGKTMWQVNIGGRVVQSFTTRWGDSHGDPWAVVSSDGDYLFLAVAAGDKRWLLGFGKKDGRLCLRMPGDKPRLAGELLYLGVAPHVREGCAVHPIDTTVAKTHAKLWHKLPEWAHSPRWHVSEVPPNHQFRNAMQFRQVKLPEDFRGPYVNYFLHEDDLVVGERVHVDGEWFQRTRRFNARGTVLWTSDVGLDRLHIAQPYSWHDSIAPFSQAGQTFGMIDLKSGRPLWQLTADSDFAVAIDRCVSKQARLLCRLGTAEKNQLAVFSLQDGGLVCALPTAENDRVVFDGRQLAIFGTTTKTLIDLQRGSISWGGLALNPPEQMAVLGQAPLSRNNCWQP